MTDEILASRAKEGDHAAFQELVRRYQGRLFSYLCYRVGRSHAEDLFQNICIKWWTRMETYERRGSFAAWAFTIARRTLIDFLEMERKRRSVSLEAAEDVPDPSLLPDRRAESREINERLASILAGLNDDQREVFLLRNFSGLSFKEIAAIQGCPLNTALARMRYALLRLRRELETIWLTP